MIRLFLAISVIFAHSFALALGCGGDKRAEPLSLWTLQQTNSGSLAVECFFFISGFLITASWIRSRSVPDYFMRRVLRIYPGFIVAITFCAALIWVLCPEFKARLDHPLPWVVTFLKDCLLLTNHSVTQSGVFDHNPFPQMGNGSLWTISMEFMCYLGVLLLGLAGLFKRRLVILAVACIVYESYLLDLYHGNDAFYHCVTCFVVGSAAWVWRDKIPFSNGIAAACFLILIVTSRFNPWFSILSPILGGYCLLWLAYARTWTVAGWADRTDLSFGTYLYAFPIQQMVAMHASLQHPWTVFVIAAPITLVCAWLSWQLVEKRCLTLKSRFRVNGVKGL